MMRINCCLIPAPCSLMCTVSLQYSTYVLYLCACYRMFQCSAVMRIAEKDIHTVYPKKKICSGFRQKTVKISYRKEKFLNKGFLQNFVLTAGCGRPQCQV